MFSAALAQLMWGHSRSCTCSLCVSVERLHRVIELGTPGGGSFTDFATLRVRNLIGELSDHIEGRLGTGESLARSPPLESGKGVSREAGQRGQEGKVAEPEKEKDAEARAGAEESGKAESTGKAATGATDRREGLQEVKVEHSDAEDSEIKGKELSAKSKALRKEVSEKEGDQEGVEVRREPEASGEGESEREAVPGVREVEVESPHRRRRRRRRSERSRTRSPKERKRAESSHRRRRRAASRSEKPVVRPSHAPQGREEVREVRRPRSPSNPPPGWSGPPTLVPARPVYRGQPESPEYHPYEGAKNKGKKKVETQRYFRDYVAERRAEKRKVREGREGPR